MSNSPLTDVTILSPCCNIRNGPVRKITIHHMAAVWSAERCGESFADITRQGSSNYGVDSAGRVGLYVPEDKRAWASNSPANDYQAVTIEVSNDEYGGQWHVSDKALAKLVDLCVDICRRNGIERLNYTGDAGGNLTRHNMFVSTTCPGPYLESKFPWITEQVNQRLEEDKPMASEEKKAFEALKQKVDALSEENADLKKRLDTYDKMGVYDNAAIRWAYIDGNLPEWSRETIKKLTKKGFLYGNDQNSLELSRLMLRLLVILDRAGCFGE